MSRALAASAERGAPCAAQEEGSDDSDCQYHRAFVGQDEGEECGEDKSKTANSFPGVVADRKGRPEQGMRYPQFGRKAEHQWAEAGGRQTGINKNDMLLRAVGRPSGEQAHQRRCKMQQSINDDSAARVFVMSTTISAGTKQSR